ncbi:hypothetical protein GIB67_013045 [Kingdonia uniflora]|uniref:Cytochrome P450 n=1 Tax=Kingdonia uniflora TaxID=39325 RepID=A0A7J7MCY6_9MAGN|nr:hypothetical protein GIB67_013045 [Kingdonia uniflora]
MAFDLAAILQAWSWWWYSNNHNNKLAKTVLTFSRFILTILWCISTKRKSRLPPGPRGLPFVGNLPFLDPDLPLYFAKLTSKYGPIFKLKLGAKICVVIGSAATAKEVLKVKDSIFANRDPPASAAVINYGGYDIVWAPCGPGWRMLRTIWIREVFNKSKLDALYGIRRREVLQTVTDIYSKVNTPINIHQQMFLTMLNVLTSMMWGGTLKAEERRTIGQEFRQVVDEVVELLGKPNVSDVFPVLARFDIQGVERQMKRLSLWFDRILDSIINQRIKFNQAKGEGSSSKDNEDILEVLLRLIKKQDPKMPFTMTHLKALFENIVVGGTDTTSVTAEWAMAEMMKHPDIMNKVQEELEKVVGRNNQVEEYHILKLHYLNAVVKETLRLHPVGPLLIPHRSSESCVVAGYTVPKDTQVFVNAWAIQRGPEIWENPLEFQPERFLRGASKWDYSGNDFSYIPFGSGRRICPGISLVERMLPYVLASLVHLFEWQLPEGTDLELSGRFGILLKKTTPLIAIPVPRFSDPKLYL